MKDLIIIGAGPAGLSACLYATRAGAEVLMLDAGAPGGKFTEVNNLFVNTSFFNYISYFFGITCMTIKYNCNFHFNHLVISIDLYS